MTESDFRAAIVAEALTWVGTPYHLNGCVRGVGSNCAAFLYAVAKASGAIGADAPAPRWYTPQLATHSKEERLIAYVLAYGAREIAEAEVKAGDIVLYKSGQAHGHAAIVLEWPRIVHVLSPWGCQTGNVGDGRLGAFTRRYFTLWSGGTDGNL